MTDAGILLNIADRAVNTIIAEVFSNANERAIDDIIDAATAFLILLDAALDTEGIGDKSDAVLGAARNQIEFRLRHGEWWEHSASMEPMIGSKPE